MACDDDIQVKSEIDVIKEDVSVLRADQSSLLQSVAEVWKIIRETDAKFVLVNKTRKEFYDSNLIIKNNSMAITSLEHKFANYVNRINVLNAAMQQQKHQQDQQHSIPVFFCSKSTVIQ